MTDHKEILRTYNAWRRDEVGDRTLEDFGITPKMVGEAIDWVLDELARKDLQIRRASPLLNHPKFGHER